MDFLCCVLSNRPNNGGLEKHIDPLHHSHHSQKKESIMVKSAGNTLQKSAKLVVVVVNS